MKKLQLYQLQPKELAGLDGTLRSLRPPVQKEDELLNKETFGLVSGAPDIIKSCNESLIRRVEDNEFTKKGIFVHNVFDKELAATHALLNDLGAETVIESAKRIVEYLRNAQDRLTRLLSIYAPGGLSDTNGSASSIATGTLSGLVLPKGISLNIQSESKSHAINYGYDPLNLPQEIRDSYVMEMAQELMKPRNEYMRIACALALMTELSGAKTDMHQTTHAESIRDIRLVNYILQELANDGELLNSGQGIKKLNSLHNALEFLIKDTPIDALKTQVNKAQNVFHNTIAPRYSLFRFESGTAAFYARGKYIDEVAQRENLGGAGDLLPTHLQKLIEVRSKPLIACES